jgi:hypothetical protein
VATFQEAVREAQEQVAAGNTSFCACRNPLPCGPLGYVGRVRWYCDWCDRPIRDEDMAEWLKRHA